MNDTNKFIFLDIKVTPHAPADQIIGWEDGRLRVKIHGVPEKGLVNANLLAFLAKKLRIAKSRLAIVSGEKTRMKRVRIEGMELDELRQKLMTFFSAS
jgi:hypothetical protein